jgi:hypothetical protein
MKITISDKPTNNSGIVLLAPSLSAVPEAFTHAGVDVRRHEQLLSEMQKLRGAVYLEDKAITADQLTQDGRHRLDVDERSWHLLTLDGTGRVRGCSRYCLYPTAVSYSELGVAKSALAGNSQWGRLLQLAVDAQVALARKLQLGFAELGGWALAREHRCTTEALRIALGTYSLASLLGEAVGLSTVTVRNCSSSILKRLGGVPIDLAGFFLPAYHDPQYNCEMEILRFDSRYPADRFKDWIHGMRQQMIDVRVVCATALSRTSMPRRETIGHYSSQGIAVARASAA